MYVYVYEYVYKHVYVYVSGGLWSYHLPDLTNCNDT